MWWNDYVGIPWRFRGEDRDGVDCAGLVAMVYRERFGCEIKAMTPTDDPRDGDIVQMAAPFSGHITPMHCGLWTTGRHVLHAKEGVGVVMEKIDRRLRKQIIGVYRVA